MPEAERREVDERAEALARQGSAVGDSPLEVSIRSLRALSRRNELLEELAGRSELPGVTQLWESESARDEPEPSSHAARTT